MLSDLGRLLSHHLFGCHCACAAYLTCSAGNFGFAEFRTAEEASAAMNLDKIFIGAPRVHAGAFRCASPPPVQLAIAHARTHAPGHAARHTTRGR
eukprot:COSAG01_NODE_31209_length_601_cov_6.217131_1_plen_95_part_00